MESEGIGMIKRRLERKEKEGVKERSRKEYKTNDV